MCSSASPSKTKQDKTVSILRNTRNLSISVLASRILGFLRDMIMSAIIGGGVLMSAWVQASTIANILRQILGEGALGQALVPILSQSYEKVGASRTREKFTTLFIYLTILLCILTLLVSVPAFLFADHFTSPIWHHAMLLIPIVMPYSVFICAVGIMTSYMNMLRVYLLPSLTAILQNLVIIGALCFICPFFTEWSKIKVMAFSVLAAGLLELLFMLWLLRRQKMTLIFSKRVFSDTATLREIFSVAFPGMIAASAHLLSVLADRIISGNIPKIAGEIGNYATAALYYTDRVTLLPIGVFAFSFGTVALTEMSRAAAVNDRNRFLDTMMFSLQSLLFLTLPLAAFFFLFGREIIDLLFMRGAFNETALNETVYALRFYVFGIPAFAALKITTSSFTARKDMKTPFFASLIAIVTNIVLNIILMFPLRQGGIALATVISSYINNILLILFLRRDLGEGLPLRSFFVFLSKLVLIAIVPLAAAWPVHFLLHKLMPYGLFADAGRLVSYLVEFLCDGVPLGAAAAVYGALLVFFGRLLKMREATDVVNRVLRR